MFLRPILSPEFKGQIGLSDPLQIPSHRCAPIETETDRRPRVLSARGMRCEESSSEVPNNSGTPTKHVKMPCGVCIYIYINSYLIVLVKIFHYTMVGAKPHIECLIIGIYRLFFCKKSWGCTRIML